MVISLRFTHLFDFLGSLSQFQVRFLLQSVSGEAKPGRLLAIMGPSGSGKTTLLNVLAGQIKASTKLHLSGLLEINGQPFSNKPFKYENLEEY